MDDVAGKKKNTNTVLENMLKKRKKNVKPADKFNSFSKYGLKDTIE